MLTAPRTAPFVGCHRLFVIDAIPQTVQGMPELPEVETVRRQLQPQLLGRRILSARAHPSDRFREATDVVGARITDLTRRGKWLLVHLDGPAPVPARDLIVHLGMTGQLTTAPPGPPLDPYERAGWSLDGDLDLRLRDVRRFGRVAVTLAGEHARLAGLAQLGPEPLAELDSPNWWDPESFVAALATSNTPVKAALLAGRTPFPCGIGNIYNDEACHLAGVHPMTRRLDRDTALRLYDAVRTVLRTGLARRGTTLRDYRDATGATGDNQHHLLCYGRAGQPCRTCGTTLLGGRVAGRGTTWCPGCQPGPDQQPAAAAA
jgi:formamidopyrimidine-DNA glycosylase